MQKDISPGAMTWAYAKILSENFTLISFLETLEIDMRGGSNFTPLRR